MIDDPIALHPAGDDEHGVRALEPAAFADGPWPPVRTLIRPSWVLVSGRPPSCARIERPGRRAEGAVERRAA